MAVENEKVIRGKDIIFFSKVGAVVTPIAFASSIKLDIKASTREIKSKDNEGDWAVRLGDKLDYSISGDGLMAMNLSGTTNGTDSLFNKLIAKQPIDFVIGTKTGTSPEWTVDTAAASFAGKIILTSLSISAGEGDNATYSFGGDAAGPLALIPKV